MAKDKRSRRDRLRDGQIEAIQKQIDARKEENEKYMDKVRFNDDMVKVLEEQINNIHAMCESQDANFKSHKADDNKKK